MRALETVSLAIWVGAMTAFAFIFAPAAFDTISDLDVFARLIAVTITAVTYVGFACAVGAATALVVGSPDRTTRVRTVCLVVMVLTSSYELWVILPSMHAILHAAGGSIAALEKDDPRRMAYDSEHRRSSFVYGITLIAGLTALILRALDAPHRRLGRGLPSEREINLSE